MWPTPVTFIFHKLCPKLRAAILQLPEVTAATSSSSSTTFLMTNCRQTTKTVEIITYATNAHRNVNA